MLELTGASSKIEGLIQVITESGYTILEVSRTGRMAMRRGHHTSRVLKALGTPRQANFATNGSPTSPTNPNRTKSSPTNSPRSTKKKSTNLTASRRRPDNA